MRLFLFCVALCILATASCSKKNSYPAAWCEAVVVGNNPNCGSNTEIKILSGLDAVDDVLQFPYSANANVFATFGLPDQYRVIGTRLLLLAGPVLSSESTACITLYFTLPGLHVVQAKDIPN